MDQVNDVIGTRRAVRRTGGYGSLQTNRSGETVTIIQFIKNECRVRAWSSFTFIYSHFVVPVFVLLSYVDLLGNAS